MVLKGAWLVFGGDIGSVSTSPIVLEHVDYLFNRLACLVKILFELESGTRRPWPKQN